MSELDDFLALASDLADAAGEAIRPHFRQRIAVDDKPDLSPVTIADRNAEAAMRRLITARFPAPMDLSESRARCQSIPNANGQIASEKVTKDESSIGHGVRVRGASSGKDER